jgi:glycosyltransferase involved in cell wall biosynthesis
MSVKAIDYSICITHYNNKPTVRESLESLLHQVDDRYEIVVVDSKSTDGSLEMLRDYAREGSIRLVEQRCTRGKGRQIAFEKSHGAIVISNLDMDEVYCDGLKRLIELYCRQAYDRLLLAISSTNVGERERQNITIGTRTVLEQLGGWRDVNYGEDWDLWRRAAEIDKFSVVVFPLVTGIDPALDRSIRMIPKLHLRYIRYVSMIQLGRKVFKKGNRITFAQRSVYLIAKSVALFKPRYNSGQGFDSYDPRFFIEDSSE